MLSDRDGLYLRNKWVAPSSGIATTYQSNDLSKPDSLQVGYSNTFQLPDSIAVRTLTENAEQLDSGSRYPYKLIPAYVIDGGEYVFRGFAKLSEFTSGSGWKVVLYEEKYDLFTRLDRSIRTADLARFDHAWTIENINARTNATDGVCYPVIDYGLISGNVVPNDTIFPAVFVHTIVRQMLKEEGYRLVGDFSTDPMAKRLILPFSEQEGVNHDEKWVKDRQARVCQSKPDYYTSRSAFDSSFVMERIQPLDIDNRPAEGWQQGVMKNYNTSSERWGYVCDSNMRLRVQAMQMFKVYVSSGSVEFLFSVEVNGNNVHQEYFEAVAPHNLFGMRTDKIEIDTKINCKQGDKVELRFICRRRTKLGGFNVTIINDPESSWAAFTPDISVQTGDDWPVARNLPDLTGRALLVSLAQCFGGTWNVDTWRKEIKFVGLTQTVENTANAVDWSNRLDTGVEPGWVPKIDPYAQANYLKWTETDESKATDGGMNYGDGVINVSDDSLDGQTDLFTLPFAASTPSGNELSGYGAPVLIKTRTVSGFGSNNVTINKQSAIPRLLLASIDGESVPVQTKRFARDGVTIEEITVNLKPCWFGPRPNVAINANTGFSLCFSPVKNLRGEMVLIDRSYEGLKRVLRRMRALGCSIRLRPDDIATLDFGRPIRLGRVALGSSLVLNTGFYYLNSINNYQSNQPCSVRLIAF